MQDRELKKSLVENGTFTNYRKRNSELYKKGLEFDKRDEVLKLEYGKNYKPCKQMMNARREQKKKVMNQFEYWMNREAGIYFITFTYKEGAFRNEKTIIQQMKNRVTKVLREFDDYSVNIDYGKKYERLHFHAIAYLNQDRIKEEKKVSGEDYKTKGNTDFDHLELMFYREETGNVYISKCGTKEEDQVKLARYLAKITSHSIKVKQSRISTKKGSDYQDAQKWQKWLKKMKTNRYFNIEKELPEVTKLAYGTRFKNQWDLIRMREYVIETISTHDKYNYGKDHLELLNM